MKQEEFDALVAKFEEANGAKITEQIKEALKDMPDFDAVKELLEKDYAEASAIAELKEILEAQGEDIAKITHKGEQKAQTLADEFKEKKDQIKGIASGRAGEVEIKALVTRASVANSPAGYVLPDIGQLGVKERSLYNVLPKIQISNGNHTGTVRYRDWDEATIARAAASVAEGAAFPESTAAFAWYSKDLKKIGDTLPVTEEFFEDEEQAASELDMFLSVNVETEIDNQLVNATGAGNDIDGLLNHAPAYTAVASGIAAANLKDLVIKMRNFITRTRGSKYRPDMVVVASSTMEDLVLAKDANNNYIFDENTGTLGGLAVVVDENMPDNQIVVGDRRYARIYEKGGVVLSRGMVNSQFTEDEMTIKARKRLLFLIREVDKTGFLKVTDVDAALTLLAT